MSALFASVLSRSEAIVGPSIIVCPLGLGSVAVSCKLSQCSTIKPSSKRKMSKPTFGPKKLYSVCAKTYSPSSKTRIVLTDASGGRFLMRAATPAGPGPTCKLCWIYLLGLTYASGTGSLVSSDFSRSMTCCLRLGAMGPPGQSLSLFIIMDHSVRYVQASQVELTDNVAMGRRKLFTREDVLDKTIPVFWKHGLAETSVQDLEQATGVRKSGLYAEFKDKEDLFVASMRQYFDMLRARGALTKH